MKLPHRQFNTMASLQEHMWRWASDRQMMMRQFRELNFAQILTNLFNCSQFRPTDSDGMSDVRPYNLRWPDFVDADTGEFLLGRSYWCYWGDSTCEALKVLIEKSRRAHKGPQKVFTKSERYLGCFVNSEPRLVNREGIQKWWNY